MNNVSGEPLTLTCVIASDPKAAVHWLKNDLIFMEDSRYIFQKNNSKKYNSNSNSNYKNKIQTPKKQNKVKKV